YLRIFMSEIAGLEKQLSTAKTAIRQRDMALKLSGNAEFRALVVDGFCRDEVVRNIGLSIDTNIDPDARQDALGAAKAGAYLHSYMRCLVMAGDLGERDIPKIESMLAELR